MTAYFYTNNANWVKNVNYFNRVFGVIYFINSRYSTNMVTCIIGFKFALLFICL